MQKLFTTKLIATIALLAAIGGPTAIAVYP